MNVVMIDGFKAEPCWKSAPTGSNESSVRPSKIPKATEGTPHLLKLAVVARASEPGPPPGAAGMLARLVWIPRAALN